MQLLPVRIDVARHRDERIASIRRCRVETSERLGGRFQNMPDPIWLGRTEKGRLILDQREQFLDYLRGLDGKEIEVCVRRRRHARSLSQNAWYHACIVKLISDYTGHSPEEVHQSLKAQFLIDRSGLEPRVRSTTELSSTEFVEFCERCCHLAGEMGLSIPSPGDAE